jgi:hypothetical protein
MAEPEHCKGALLPMGLFPRPPPADRQGFRAVPGFSVPRLIFRIGERLNGRFHRPQPDVAIRTYPSSTMELTSLPRPVISISIVSPAFIHCLSL